MRQFASCVASIANSSVEQIYEHYGLPRRIPGRLFDGEPADMAVRLRAQATLLRDLGFEGTLIHTRVKNTTGKLPAVYGFYPPPPCCALRARRPDVPGPDFTCTAHSAS